MQSWEPPQSHDSSSARASDGTGPEDIEDEALVRPFVITGGRARHATVHLRVESLVASPGSPPEGALQFEHAAILAVCRNPVSVAEVAARVSLPLGVAQVLVGDLADAGLVRVHEATPTATPALLLRMIDAVRAL
jgi:hypothetical protein